MMDATVRPAGACTLCGGSEARERFVKLERRFLECRGCGLVWIDPMPTPADLDAYYSAAYSGGRYSAFAEAQEIRRLISEHRLERVRALAKPPGETVPRWLDVGCATGDFLAAAGAAGIEAEGLDISQDAVGRARARGLVAHHSRVEDFSPERLYDAITAFDLLEHLLDPRAFISRLRGWLRTDGELVLTLPDVGSIFPRFLMGRHWFYYWPDEHLFYFDPVTISRLLTEEGFDVVRIGRAYKPLTFRYSAHNLETFNEAFGRIARRVVDLLPDKLTAHPWKLYVGEMIVLARRADGTRA